MITDILICSLVITGLYATTQSEMIFEGIANRLTLILPYFIQKPLFKCIICMASIWGSIYYFANFDFAIIQYIKFIFAVAGLNTIIAYKILND